MQKTRNDLPFSRPGSSLAMAFAALMLFAEASYAMSAPPTDPKVITAADAGKTVSLIVGEQLTVRLDAQPGTGFGWEPDATSTPLLSSKGSTLSGGNIPGGVETQSLTFVARAAGEGNLKLVYRRGWENDVPPAKSFSVTVKIAAH
jgi:predicted secreted protein